MRKNFLYRGMMLLASALTIASCSNEAEEMRPQGTRALDVQVAVNPTSRAQVIGTSLPEGAQIGVNVTATDGSEYDGQNVGYLNVPYTATGTGTSQTWGSTAPVMLSGTEGKMYAYYPYTAGIDYTAVSVDITDQHDWMYGTEAYSVSDKAPSADVVLAHAQTALNINVVRDNAYTGAGLVETLAVTSDGLASTGTLDTRDGSWSAQAGANTAISIISAPFTLASAAANQENPYMFVPATDETKDFTVTATVDGKAYNVGVAMNEAFAPGKMYQLNVKVTNTGLTVSKVTLTDWVIDATLEDATFAPEEEQNTTASNEARVYAVRSSDEALISLENVDTENEEYIAVALHVTGENFDEKFWIEKHDGFSWSIDESLWYTLMASWEMTDAPETHEFRDLSLTNYVNVDGVNDFGGWGEGSDIPILSDDFTKWTEGALSDFNGKENSEVLKQSLTAEGEIGKAILLYNENQPKYKDWYIPAEGQLGLIAIYLEKINEMMTAIGGVAFFGGNYPKYVWSSTEYDASSAWFLVSYQGVHGLTCFDDTNPSKHQPLYLLYIRDYE